MAFKLPGKFGKKAGGATKKAGFGGASKPKPVGWGGLTGSMGLNPHRGMVIRNQNASLDRERGKYGSVRAKPSTVAPRKVATRAAAAARGGSRTAAKRVSKRY
jgi:hypothetical protein